MAEDEKVRLRNSTRRPLTLRVAGRTVRLSPGERLEVPGSWLGSGELQRFCGNGLVAAEPVAKKRDPEEAGEQEAGPEDGPEDGPDGEQDEDNGEQEEGAASTSQSARARSQGAKKQSKGRNQPPKHGD